jgi:hypothetical protein
VENGLVIDLSRYFYHAAFDPEKHAARISGCSLCQTDENEAIKYGLGSVVESVNRVRF